MSFRIGLGLAVMISALAASGRASAQECADDSDCAKSWTCEVTSTGGCDGVTERPCVEGEACPEPEPVKCDTTEYKSCVPGPCSGDGDCEAGMVCHTETIESCDGGDTTPAACADGEQCPEPEPVKEPVCTTEEKSSCVPKYTLPCATASDCGEGFECKAIEPCQCAGSSGGGSDPGAGGDGDLPQERTIDAGVEPDARDGSAPACECQPSDTKHCEPVMVECETAGECPTDWTCEEQAGGDGDVSCAAAEPADGADGEPKDTACIVVDASTAEPVSVSYCVPPFSDLGFGFGGRAEVQADSAAGENTKGESDPTSAPTGAGSDDGSEEPAAEESDDCSVSRVGGHDGSHGALWLSALGLCVAALRMRRRTRR
jgi:hypothetical protein